MKCHKCNKEVNEGDQICIHCGAKLALENSMPLKIDAQEKITEKNKISMIMIIGPIILIILSIIIIFFALKG